MGADIIGRKEDGGGRFFRNVRTKRYCTFQKHTKNTVISTIIATNSWKRIFTILCAEEKKNGSFLRQRGENLIQRVSSNGLVSMIEPVTESSMFAADTSEYILPLTLRWKQEHVSLVTGPLSRVLNLHITLNLRDKQIYCINLLNVQKIVARKLTPWLLTTFR
jgi:hypothetical protein